MSDTKEDRYLLARRSIHIWPLTTASPVAFGVFAAQYLQMTEDELRSFEIISIQRCRHQYEAKIQNEFSGEFATIASRDYFRSFAPRLQPFCRTAGMRLAIPDFLVSSFKILEHEGFQIAQKRPGTKRSIKFDDATRSLALDIKLPDSAWVRIMADDVQHAAATRKKQRVPAVLELLAISADPLPPPPPSDVDADNFIEESDTDMTGDDVAADQ